MYFELVWNEEGFGPGEIDTVELLGEEVRIKPTLSSVMYYTGDGEGVGPTDSLGGTYPDGDITHTYLESGSVAPYAEVEYGGQYSINGGEWQGISGSSVVEGPTAEIQVFRSRNRLTDPDDAR